MRTTLTLEPDIAVKLKALVSTGKVTLKQAVNDALRRGLNQKPAKAKPYRVKPFDGGGLLPGIDPNKLGQFLDQLEVEDYLAKQARDLENLRGKR